MAGELIAHLWQRRVFIAKFMAATILVLLVVLLLIPKKYRAECTIILIPPRFVSEVRTQSLSVPTARNLLMSGEITQQVIDLVKAGNVLLSEQAQIIGGKGALDAKLGAGESLDFAAIAKDNLALGDWLATLSSDELQALLGYDAAELEDWTVDSLVESFSSEEIVEKKTATDVTLSPIIKLLVVSDTGSRAQLLANTWAFIFEKKYDDITNSKTRRQYESIAKQQLASEADLDTITSEVVTFKARNNIALYKRLLEEHSKNLGRFTSQKVQTAQQLANAQRALDEMIQINLAVTDPKGSWIGYYTPTADSNTTDLSAYLANINTPPPGLADQYKSLRQKAIESLSMMHGSMSEVEDFYLKYPVEMMEKDLTQMQTDYIALESRLRTAQIRLKTLSDALAAIDDKLSSTKQFLVLSTQVPAETIGQAVATGRAEDLRRLSNVQFQEERMNPVWESLQKQRAEIGNEYEQVLSEVATLEKGLPDKRVEVTTLQADLYRSRMREKLMKNNLANWTEMNKQLSADFTRNSSDIYTTQQLTLFLTQQLEQLDQETSQAKDLVEGYQSKIDMAEAQMELLATRQRAVQKNADLLLEKLQAAQVARDQELSDISIAARAVAPARHFFPRRSVFMIFLTLVTFILLSGALSRQKYLELTQA
jgi:uncharacterized protein involved in exopolysaccharide biosynthesis